MGIENPCVAVTCFLLLQSGNTSLHHASSNGRTELCELLLRAKADVEAKDEVLEATRGDRYCGNMRTQPDQRCHSMTKISACERSGGRS